MWAARSGPSVFAAFAEDSEDFSRRDQRVMVNFRVADLDAMVSQLRAAGAEVSPDTQEMEGVGRFAWVTDPEGRRVELWEPAG